MSSHRRHRDALTAMKSPTLTPKKKMTWKELESSVASTDAKKATTTHRQRPPRSPPRRTLPSTASTSAATTGASTTTKGSSSSPVVDSTRPSPKPSSSSDSSTTNTATGDYVTSRRNRLAKKNHLLGNRGKCSPDGWRSPPQQQQQLVGTPSSNTPASTSSTSTPRHSHQAQPPVRKTSNSVSALLLSPTNYVKTSAGTLDFEMEKDSDSSTKKTVRNSGGSSRTQLRATNTPIQRASNNTDAKEKPQRSVVSTTSSRTPPRATSTPKQRASNNIDAKKRKQLRSVASNATSRTPPTPRAASTPRQRATRNDAISREKRSTSSNKNKTLLSAARHAARTPPRAASTPRKTRASPPLDCTTPEEEHSCRTPLQSLPLSVEREKNQRKERGCSSSNNKENSPKSMTRRNLDKRSARLLYSNEFCADIQKFRQDHPYLNNGTNHEGETNLHLRGVGGRSNNNNRGVAVVCRKRPIFEYETLRGDFDVVSIDATTRYDSNVVMVHNCTMHNDMRQMLVKPVSFPCFSAAFDEQCTNENLYQHVAAPLVRSVVKGGIATLLLYGQTGSGKTHTMGGIEERAAHDLFRSIASLECRGAQVKVQFVELSGKLCKDLLSDNSSDGLDVRVVDQENGTVRLMNAMSASVALPQELTRVMAQAKRRRATEATDKNGVSSRSHAVCQITVTYESSSNSQENTRGMLTLIDCAGSERRNDSLYHSSVRQKESTQINASLFALKECLRARAANRTQHKKTHVPYRSSNLTRILRETLEKDEAQLCVIATVAPNATDTEHTLETLKTVSSLVGTESSMEDGETHTVTSTTVPAAEEAVPPKQWDHDSLKKWMTKKRLVPKSMPEHVDGRVIMRMSCLQLRNLLYDDADRDKADKAEKLFKALRAESDRVARIQVKQRLSLSKGRRNTLE